MCQNVLPPLLLVDLLQVNNDGLLIDCGLSLLQQMEGTIIWRLSHGSTKYSPLPWSPGKVPLPWWDLALWTRLRVSYVQLLRWAALHEYLLGQVRLHLVHQVVVSMNKVKLAIMAHKLDNARWTVCTTCLPVLRPLSHVQSSPFLHAVLSSSFPPRCPTWWCWLWWCLEGAMRVYLI